MLSQIEAELRKRSVDNENLRLLLAQWEYDRLLLGQALTTVGHAFPHYSLHDATHSETILERIAAMLGNDTISSLSGTDLWLLLESAYLHDSGMVVLESTRRKDLSSSEFKAHIRTTAEGADRELAARAARLQVMNTPENLIGILEGHLDLLLVYAEFVRKWHPRRAEDVALSPFEHARVESPRTTLLPNRFWHLIGRICRAHGENRDFILHELPLHESGVSGELCHPRFIASMLRLGDLLDLDSGRFCPTINATIPQLPGISEAHRIKHAGIRRLLVCPTRIEVSGVYNDVDAYLEAERWFSWLREELSAQLIQWDKIAPSNIGSLPSVGSIEARLEGQITLDTAAKPRFEVDREKMIELVQGANIYDGPEDAVREVVQNAIDATLLRFSYDSQSNEDLPPKNLDDLREKLSRYPIVVSLVKALEQPEDPDKVEWILTVKDQGMGIRVEDAKFMLTLGSSKKNNYRRALKEWLPDWARPSGTFGIGFHSLFLYCHEVIVTTRHPEDPEGLKITFTTQPQSTETTVIIKRRSRSGGEVTFAPQAGTLVEAKFQVDRFARDFQKFMRGEERVLRGGRTLAKFDFVLDDEIQRVAAAISESVSDMAKASLCPLRLTLPESAHDKDMGRPENVLLPYFDSQEGTELRIIECSLEGGYLRPRYRGAEINRGSLNTILFKGECDLHTSEADKFLELSRNAFTYDGKEKAQEQLNRVFRSAISEWLNQLRDSTFETDKQLLSYVSLYAMLKEIGGHGSEWKDIPYKLESYDHNAPPLVLPLGTIASASKIIIYESFSRTKPSFEDNVVSFREPNLNGVKQWLSLFLRKFFPQRKLVTIKGSEVRYHLMAGSDGIIEDVDDDVLIDLFTLSYRSRIREVLPCPHRFANLTYQSNRESRQEGDWSWLISATIASPFIFTGQKFDNSSYIYSVSIPRVDRYVQWLAKERSEPESLIATRLLEFIRYMDSLMEGKWKGPKHYDLNAIESTLGQMMH
jgi:hypothetical protein